MKKFIFTIGLISILAIVLKILRGNQQVCVECKFPDGKTNDYCGKRKHAIDFKKYSESPSVKGANQFNNTAGVCSMTKYNKSWAQDPDL